jgi:hypothetical protein
LDLNGSNADRRENYIMMNFIACILHRILLGWLNQGGGGSGRDMLHAWGRGVQSVLVGSTEDKRPLGRYWHTWEDNIKIHLREKRINGTNWIPLAEDRVHWRAFVNFVNTIMFLRVP